MSYTTTNHISLDIYNNSIICVNAKQYDTNARSVEVTCTENGKKIVLVQDEVKAYISCQKPDGKYVYNDATILENGNIQVELTQQMLAEAGRCKVDVMLLDADGEININKNNELVLLNSSVLTTMYFYINVLSSTVNHSDIESSNEYNALLHAMSRNVALEKELQENEYGIIDENGKVIQDGRKQAEEKRVQAENLRVNAENARILAEKSRVIAEIARDNAENGEFDDNGNLIKDGRVQVEESRVKAENLRVEAEMARDIAENGEFDENGTLIADGRVQSENKRVESENLRVQAEIARDNAENGEFDEEGNLIIDGRVQVEEARVVAENARVDAENARDIAENGEFDDDGNLITDGRVQAEEKRVAAETERATSFTNKMDEWNTQISNTISGFESDVNEVIKNCNDAETLRVSAESSRVSAENSRVIAEETRETKTASAISACEEATNNANVASKACHEIIDKLNIQEITTTVSLSTLEWTGSETEKYHAVISDIDLTDKVVISFYITSWSNLTPNDVVQPYCDGTNMMVMANTNFKNTETDITIKILYY